MLIRFRRLSRYVNRKFIVHKVGLSTVGNTYYTALGCPVLRCPWLCMTCVGICVFRAVFRQFLTGKMRWTTKHTSVNSLVRQTPFLLNFMMVFLITTSKVMKLKMVIKQMKKYLEEKYGSPQQESNPQSSRFCWDALTYHHRTLHLGSTFNINQSNMVNKLRLASTLNNVLCTL